MHQETIRILLVDSDEEDYILTRNLLAKLPQQFILDWAKDCQDALRRLSLIAYHICFLEYTIGKQSGIELLKKAKEKNYPTPIIMLTDQGDLAADVQAMRHGAADYLIKKFVTPSLLERSIRYTLERQKTERERLKLLHEQAKRIEAESAQKRVSLLADASKVLASSLDYRETLRTLANLLVPHMADWCIVDILHGQEFERLVVVHKDPKKRKFALKLQRDYPPDLSSPGGVGKVLRTGELEIQETLSEETALKTARNDKKLLRLLKKLGLKSYMMIPILSRGRVLGCLTLNHGESQRQYTNYDLSYIQDLTRRIALAIDNAMLYEKAQDGIRIRDEFLNIASHELKTPLTSLHLQMQILTHALAKKKIALSPKKLEQLLDSNSRQLQRLTKLINSLLDVSRIHAKSIHLEPEKTDLAEITKDVVNRFRDEAKNSGTKLIYKNSVHVYGYWDKFRLDQAATNLIANALKYGQSKPVTISVGATKKYAKLTVKDHGIGISPSDKERIFDRFERTELAKSFGGLGLGLYITKQIIDAHGGKISVLSKLQKGSTFVVSLPLSLSK